MHLVNIVCSKPYILFYSSKWINQCWIKKFIFLVWHFKTIYFRTEVVNIGITALDNTSTKVKGKIQYPWNLLNTTVLLKSCALLLVSTLKQWRDNLLHSQKIGYSYQKCKFIE